MDYFAILALRRHLDGIFAGSACDDIVLHDRRHLFLTFGDRALRLSCVPDMPYVFAAEARFVPRRGATPWHRSRFAQRTLTGVAITPGDRILTFTFEGGIRLVFEMTGRNANIIAVEPEGGIAGTLRTVIGATSGVRQIRPGIPYEPPPAREFPDPARDTPGELERRLRAVVDTLESAVRQGIAMGSRVFAREACVRAGLDPAGYAADLGDAAIARLIAETSALAEACAAGGEGGSVIVRGDGVPQDVFPLRLEADWSGTTYFDDLNDAVVSYARGREIALERKSLETAVRSALAREERSIRSTMAKVARERGDDDEPERLERIGNTILANINLLKRGTDTADLPDPYGGGTVTVALDPSLDGPANARAMFRRAAKLRSADARAGDRLTMLGQRLERIAEARARVDAAEDIRELRDLAAVHVRSQESRRTPDEEDRFPRRFRSSSGLEIIVGRNDTENDDLVRWANRDDLWLHAQNIGGSHVILRTPGRQNPDRRSIEDAAAIAAHYSKARTSGVVPVACTKVKYVVKRRGQGPGKVTYTREEVVFVEPGIPGSGT